MQIRRNVNMFGEIKMVENEKEVVVANLNASINNNGDSYSINVNFIRKDIIDATSDNALFYESEYALFEKAVKAEIK